MQQALLGRQQGADRGYGYRLRSVEADEYEDAYSYTLYVDVGAVMQYSAYLNADFFGNNI